MSSKKRIAILGSTGSIGTQALDVIRNHSEKFEVSVLTTNTNADLLMEQVREFEPNTVVIVSEEGHAKINDECWNLGTKCYTGEEALVDVCSMDEIDIVLTALVGFSGLKPTLKAIEYGKNIALANKETLVVAGEIITQRAKEKGVNIYPVDSEHSAIFQCIVGEFHNPLEKVYLTASGGPFRGKNRNELKSVTVKESLNHPNWSMGAKITIDSATMMNKGLEIIEAKWLFGLKEDQIDVIVHPQSIIHSIAQFRDGSMKAQMGLPNMKLPIQFALSYPNRIESNFERFNFLDYPSLTFEAPDQETFINLRLAYEALKKGGNMPCALNAANEVTNQAFIDGKIGFLDIGDINEKVVQNISFQNKPELEQLFETDNESRRIAVELIK
ncbi:MAG: 1-deoxy-D-xylulose-5-phosphate reductoisomerase [Crocinitomicaceae bacterium]|nr:1-deoxy-D-xylulose-5-phosphate reductoisomerase [Crocinitomicaceae bacterium]